MAKRSESTSEFDAAKKNGEFTIPNIDIEKIAILQNKNLEALSKANKLAVDGVQTVLKRQAEFLPEIMRQAIEEGTTAVREMTETGDPKDAVLRQCAFAKETFNRTIAHATELSEIIAKSNSEALDLLNTYFAAIVDEIKESTPLFGFGLFGTDMFPLSIEPSPKMERQGYRNAAQ